MPIRAGIDPVKSAEAIAWFHAKAKVDRATWQSLDAAGRARSFNVAGLVTLRVVDTVFRALERAIAEGVAFPTFRAEVLASVRADWGAPSDKAGEAAEGRMLRTVFENHAGASYAAGRLARLAEPGAIARRPYRLYSAVTDPKTTKICRARNGIILPADDPWWADNECPLHHRCRSQIISLRRSQAEARGILAAPPEGLPSPGKGWGSRDALLGKVPIKAELAPAVAKAFKPPKRGKPPAGVPSLVPAAPKRPKAAPKGKAGGKAPRRRKAPA